jgi:hypothetical protein
VRGIDRTIADLDHLVNVEGLDDGEARRRRELLELFRTSHAENPIDYTTLTMQRRR